MVRKLSRVHLSQIDGNSSGNFLPACRLVRKRTRIRRNHVENSIFLSDMMLAFEESPLLVPRRISPPSTFGKHFIKLSGQLVVGPIDDSPYQK